VVSKSLTLIRVTGWNYIAAAAQSSSRRLFRIPGKPIGQDEKRGCPKPDEDAETLAMCLGFDRLSSRRVPNHNGTDDRSEPEDEAKVAEEIELSGFHEVSLKGEEVCPSS